MKKLLENWNNFLKKEKYWHATSLSNAEKILQDGFLKTGEKGVFAIGANTLKPEVLMSDVQMWFRGRNLPAEDFAVIEFMTDQKPDRFSGIIVQWNDDVSVNNAKIILRT